MKRIFWSLVIIASIGLTFSTMSCQHDPIMPDGTTPVDTTGNPIDTTTQTGTPCNPDIVYFDLQVLPLLRSNCALSGCHDDITHEEGLKLTSYENVMQDDELVVAFNLNESKLYKAITETEQDERMPPAPANALNAEQINLISKWILQGAKDLSCDPDAGQCNTSNVTYSGVIVPLIQNTCIGCHSGTAPQGGINLSTYAGVKAVVNNGKLMGSINHNAGFIAMPYGGNKMPQCNIDKIQAWVNAGAPQN